MDVKELKDAIGRMAATVNAAAKLPANEEVSKEILADMFTGAVLIFGELAVDIKRIMNALESIDTSIDRQG